MSGNVRFMQPNCQAMFRQRCQAAAHVSASRKPGSLTRRILRSARRTRVSRMRVCVCAKRFKPSAEGGPGSPRANLRAFVIYLRSSGHSAAR